MICQKGGARSTAAKTHSSFPQGGRLVHQRTASPIDTPKSGGWGGADHVGMTPSGHASAKGEGRQGWGLSSAATIAAVTAHQ